MYIFFCLVKFKAYKNNWYIINKKKHSIDQLIYDKKKYYMLGYTNRKSV